jgi:hypothetical protein
MIYYTSNINAITGMYPQALLVLQDRVLLMFFAHAGTKLPSIWDYWHVPTYLVKRFNFVSLSKGLILSYHLTERTSLINSPVYT